MEGRRSKAGCKATDKRRRLSALGVISLASILRDRQPGWSEVAQRIGLPDSFVAEVRRSAGDIRRSEEVEFLQRLSSEHEEVEIMKFLETAGFSDLVEIIKETRKNECRDERVLCIPFEVENTGEDFQIETLGSASLEECLKPFCDEKQISVDNIQFLSPRWRMSTLASEVNTQGVVQLRLTESTRRSQVTQTTSTKSGPTRIRTTIMMQIGDNTKMYMRPQGYPSDVDGTEDDSDAISTFSEAAESSVYSSAPPSPPFTPPPTPPAMQRVPPRSIPQKPPRTPPRIQTQRFTYDHRQRKLSSQQQLHMSDVSDGEDEPVEYENHNSFRTAHIPSDIMAAARNVKGFWDLPTDHHIRAAHTKLLARFGEKDGRYIVWQYGRQRLVASVTYEGSLRHFQIVWTRGQLTVHCGASGVSAPDLGSLMQKLPTAPLPLRSHAASVRLRSPIERIPEEQPSYEEPVSYMVMSGTETCESQQEISSRL